MAATLPEPVCPIRIQFLSIRFLRDVDTVFNPECIRMHMETRDKALIAVIAIVAVLTAFVAVGTMTGDDAEWDFPEEVTAEDKAYPEASVARADFESQRTETAAVLSDADASADSMIESIDALAEDYLQIRDWYSWVNRDYYLDTVEYGQKFKDWTELVQHTGDAYFSTVKAGLDGSCATTVERALESAGVDPAVFREYNEMSEEEKELNKQITDLQTTYDRIMAGTYPTVTEMYEAAAETYVQLVGVNNDIARLKGFDSYADYAYKEIYSRDYTPDDARKLSGVLGTATGAMLSCSELRYSNPTFSSAELGWMTDLTSEQVVSTVASYTDTIADMYADLLDYMEECDLIYLNRQTDDGLIGQAYTSDILMRSSAYILINGYGGSGAVTTFAHEFGHASATCLNRDLTSCMDVEEIHSMGMEALLATSGASALRGCGAALSADFLDSTIQTVVTGILFTEIELFAYETEAETGTLTVEMLEREFKSMLESAGLKFHTECDDLYWVNVPHLFSSPMYYISYVTSSLDAVEIFAEAVEDHDAAERRYLGLVGQRGIDGYVEAVEKAGLTNAFDIEASERILQDAYRALRTMARCRRPRRKDLLRRKPFLYHSSWAAVVISWSTSRWRVRMRM